MYGAGSTEPTTMATFLRYDTTPLPDDLTLVLGNILPFKVLGLGADHKHLEIRSSSAAVTITVVSANPHNAEQSLKMFAKQLTNATPAELSAYTQDGKPDPKTPVIKVTVAAQVELPAANTEAGALARMLLIENVTPGGPGYDVKQTLTTMRWMRWVFVNQLRFGSQWFAHGTKVTTVTDLIKAGGQVAGFEQYPTIDPAKNKLLLSILSIQNNAADGRFAAYRQYVQNAIDVAKAEEKAIGDDPCSTGLYGWRTAGATSPGKNYVKFKTQGGQDFYTLTPGYLKNPAHPDGK
jgi:hypothetical protein